MDHDFKSKKFSYTTNSYIKVLDAKVAPIFIDINPTYLFMQDNAPIHIARKVIE